jgi:methionyl-tRNA formyltransferase
VARLVFAGSSDFAVPTLEALAGGTEALVGVLTQPERPAGRRRRLTPTPVGQRAAELGLPVLTPPTLRTPEAEAALAALRPDALVVVDYGLLLPQRILDLPPAGCINGHASLLPRWRGAAPIQHAIRAGDRVTGVSIMLMDKGLDTGPVYKIQELEIGELETAGELRERLARLCAELLAATLPDILGGRLAARPQDGAAATYAPKIVPEDAELAWDHPAQDLVRQILAFAPRPGAWTVWQGQRLKLHRARAISEREGPPGRVWRAGPAGVDIAAGAGSVRALELQAPGGRVLSAREFLNGRALLGEQLGE